MRQPEEVPKAGDKGVFGVEVFDGVFLVFMVFSWGFLVTY